MGLILKSKLIQRTLMFFEVAGSIALATWIGKAYVAGVVASPPTVKNLERAVKLDPNNSGYHLSLGELFLYNVPDINPDRAVEHLRRAAELDPLSPQPWLELAFALEIQGKTSDAEGCMRRAAFLAPNLPYVHWAIGNFFLVHGNLDEAFRHFRVVLAGTSQYDETLFETAWKASGDPGKILEQLIPNHVPTEFSYLYYLVSQKRFSEAQSVWKRIAVSPETSTAAQVSAYIDNLIAARRPAEASQVWDDLRRKGLIKAPYARTSQNLVLNGDFEEEILSMGFDWRIIPLKGAYASLDPTTFHSPSHALMVQFSGKVNVDFRSVWQYVLVAPKQAYRLQAFAKTEGITTDSGPRLEVYDAYDPTVLDKFSEGLTGSTPGWTPLTVDFTTGPETELIVVAVARRLPSQKLDNLIAGKVWIDDVTVSPAP